MREARAIIGDLAQSGLDATQIALMMELMAAIAVEGRPAADPQATRRRANDRDRKRRLRNSAESADEPPIDKDHTPLSDPNGSVAEATGQVEIDPAKQLFDLGIDLMVRTEGMTDKQARSYIGGLRKDHGEANALTAVIEARLKNISRPAEWLVKRCKSQGPPGSNRQALYRQADRIQDQAA